MKQTGRITTLTLEQIIEIPGVHLWPYRREEGGIYLDTAEKAVSKCYDVIRRPDRAHITLQVEHKILVNPHYPYDSEPCLLIYVSHTLSPEDYQ